MNLAEILLEQVQHRANSTALIEPYGRSSRALDFAGLERASARAALALLASGLQAGDRVLLLVPMSIELYVVLIGLLRAGLVAVVLDPSAGRSFVDAACDRVRPRALVCSGRARWLVPWIGGLRRIPCKILGSGPWPFPARRLPTVFGDAPAAAQPMATVHDDAPALITFTSGSTGMPKAAVRTHAFLRAQHRELTTAIELHADQVDLATLPVFVLANLGSGVCSVLPRADLRRPGAIDAGPVLRQIDEHRVQRSTASPAFYARIADACERQGRTLEAMERLYLGGAPVFPSLLRRMQRLLPRGRVANVYGSTEAEPIAHIFADEIMEADQRAMREGAGLLVGTPTPGTRLAIVRSAGIGTTPREDDALEIEASNFAALEAGVGEPGEIVVTGEHVLRGYLDGRGDGQTKIRVGGAVWHRTGDAGSLDARGRLWLLGRASEQIFDARGVAHPFAVECAASEVDGVARSALIALDGRRVLAVELAPRAGAGSVRRDLQAALDFAGLDEIRVVASIPVDRRHNAKVDYPALRRSLAPPSRTP